MSTLTKFYKMHSYGNDFIIIEDNVLGESLIPSQIKFLCDRKLGIGCDQLLVYKNHSNFVEMKIFNSDSSETTFCGNGTRCLAGFLLKKIKDYMFIKTGTGILKCELVSDCSVQINIGQPSLNWKQIPLSNELLNNELNIKILKDNSENISVKGYCINVGNPHVVIFVQNFDFDLNLNGKLIQDMPIFPQKINVNFCHVVDDQNISLRVYERGAGLTLACGSGACASAYCSWKNGLVKKCVTVNFELGSILICIGENNDIFMTGNFSFVYSGEVKI